MGCPLHDLASLHAGKTPWHAVKLRACARVAHRRTPTVRSVSHTGRPRVLPMACVLSTTSLEMIPMLAPQRKALRLVHRVICQELAGVRQRQPEGNSSSQG